MLAVPPISFFNNLLDGYCRNEYLSPVPGRGRQEAADQQRARNRRGCGANYGLGNALTFPLSVGATAVLMAECPTADAVYARPVHHRPTIFSGVPTLYASMMASPRLPARADVALRICTSASEALPREIGERFTAHFACEVLDGIGSTEMLHIFLSNRVGHVEYGTTGTPVLGYAVELRDETGQPAPDGEIGDLYVKAPSAALTYWCNREKSRATFLGEWLRSGDKYCRLPNGCYVYAGRSDDMLKVSGQYVSPVEVEMVLVEHDAVLEGAVVGGRSRWPGQDTRICRAQAASPGAVRATGNGMSKPRKAGLPVRGRCARRGALKGLAMGEVDYQGG